MLNAEERKIVDNIHNFMLYTDKFIKIQNGEEIKIDATILLFGEYKTTIQLLVEISMANLKMPLFI